MGECGGGKVWEMRRGDKGKNEKELHAVPALRELMVEDSR